MMPAGSIEYLFSSGFKEILFFLITYTFLLLCAGIAKRLSLGKALAFSIVIVGIAILIIPAYGAKMELSISILLALLCVTAFVLIGLSDFTVVDALFLFALFLTPKRFFNSAGMLLGTGIHFLYILMIVLGYGRVKSGALKGKFLQYYVTFIYVSLVSYVFNTLCNEIVSHYRSSRHSSGIWSFGAAFVLFILLEGLTVFLCRKLKDQKLYLQILEGRYPEIEKYLYIFTGFTIVVLLATHIPFVLTRTSSNTLLNVLSIFYIALLLIQMLFLILFYQMAYYKDALRFKEQEQKNEENYYLSLQKNLDSMADLRHDIKNLFLTMGNFVERSQDEEMKKFYKEKIFPFAIDEIEKNYLFSQLYQIPNETLRAFLHMKLFQANNRKENVKLQIQIDNASFFLGMDIIDLTRILGILLDNALEECDGAVDSYIEIHIRNNPALCTYTIKNSRCNYHKEPDFVRGFSTKAGHTGLGLSIVQSIINLYPQADLNTYGDKEFYMQSLNIRREV